MLKKTMPRLTYANVMSTVAVFGMLAGGTAWAATSAIGTKDIKDGAVTNAKLHASAVTSDKVKDFSLRLHDLGGQGKTSTSVVSSSTTVPSGGCALFQLTSLSAPQRGIGSLVVGFLTNAQGKPVLDNDGAVIPTMVSGTSQGGAIANLMVCSTSAAGETVPAGSVFHYHLIGP